MTQRKKDLARAIADVTKGIVLATVEIAATPERVFRALTSPEEIVRWWGEEELYRTTSWNADFKVGGAWRAEGRGADGEPFHVEGTYLEIEAPRKLVQTWRPSFDEGETTVSYLLEPTDVGTRITLRHDGFGKRTDSLRGHTAGWERVFNWLSDFASQPTAAESYFLCRLLGPRPTFAFDMNEEEKAVMQAHGQYWRARQAEGKVLVFGPVADPKGPWGLGIVRASDEGGARAWLDKDPAILSGRGFRVEIMPMLQAIVE